MHKILFSLAVLTAFASQSLAQIGIGTNRPQSMLEIVGSDNDGIYSKKDGVLIPRVSAIPNVEGVDEGELVYVNGKGFYYYSGTGNSWSPIGGSSNSTGTSTSSAGKFKDGKNTDHAVYTDGNVGIATRLPQAKLDLHGDFRINSTIKSNDFVKMYFFESGIHQNADGYEFIVESAQNSGMRFDLKHNEPTDAITFARSFGGGYNIAPVMELKGSGNVEIGRPIDVPIEDNNTDRLHVNGTSSATNFKSKVVDVYGEFVEMSFGNDEPSVYRVREPELFFLMDIPKPEDVGRRFTIINYTDGDVGLGCVDSDYSIFYNGRDQPDFQLDKGEAAEFIITDSNRGGAFTLVNFYQLF